MALYSTFGGNTGIYTDFGPSVASGSISPLATNTDPMLAKQWHLTGTTLGRVSTPNINVAGAWQDYSGKGIHVGIYDEGVSATHADLAANYDASLHLPMGVNGTPWTGAPVNNWQSHGTAVAGLIAAANNGVGAVGVAHGSHITGANIFAMSAQQLSTAMNYQDQFDVVNHSWGWLQQYVDNPTSPLWKSFFTGLQDAADNGRGGLGTVMVVSAGNDRLKGDETNTSGFLSSRYTVDVGAIGDNGFVASYSNPGATLMVVAPSSGGRMPITTTDREGGLGYSRTDYTELFGGTSAAAPMVSGVAALMLEANGDLGWRDVQEILALSARHVGSAFGMKTATEEGYWQWNGATNWNGGGMHFSNDYGYGLVDATAAVRLAETWTMSSTSANERIASAQTGANWTISSLAPSSQSFSLTLTDDIQIESVALELRGFSHTASGNLVIDLVSPDGTSSRLLFNSGGTTDITTGWSLGSNAFRGEMSAGTWTVTIQDTVAGDGGRLSSLELRAFGHNETGPDDTYYYTMDFGKFGLNERAVLRDTDGGTDTINASAVNYNTILDMNEGGLSRLALRNFTIEQGSQFENAITGDGNDVIIGNALDNVIHAMRGSDRVSAGDGNDTVFGGLGNDKLLGEGGNDQLSGGDGYDRLEGGDGDDLLNGGAGDDLLTGGTGSDSFIFDQALGGLFDTIVDFESGIDHLVFTGRWQEGHTLDLTQMQFVLVDAASATTDQTTLLYDTQTGILSMDWDGTGEAAAIQIALLQNRSALTTQDFMFA